MPRSRHAAGRPAGSSRGRRPYRHGPGRSRRPGSGRPARGRGAPAPAPSAYGRPRPSALLGFFLRDSADEFAEILGLAEVAIDTGEADIGDLVEGGQRFHDQLADLISRDIGLARAFQLADDRIDHPLDPLGLDRALADRSVDRARELFPLERFTLAVLLDHG